MPRFCANCGTEVDDTALFCPTCGQPIDQEADSDIPPAPAWPDPEPQAPRAAVPPPAPDRGGALEPTPRGSTFDDTGDRPGFEDRAHDRSADDHRDWQRPSADEPTRLEPRPPDRASGAYPASGGEERSTYAPAGRADTPAATAGSADARRSTPAVPPQSSDGRAGTGQGRASRGRGTNLPLTTPVTISAWLIGIGAVVAAVGALISLFDGLGTAVDLLMLLALVGVAVTVFLSANLPAIPHLRLATLIVVLVTLGVALDRLVLGRAGAGELLLFLGAAAAAIGAILVETGNDQPMGGTSR